MTTFSLLGYFLQPLHNSDHPLGIHGTVGKQLLPYPCYLFGRYVLKCDTQKSEAGIVSFSYRHSLVTLSGYRWEHILQ